MKVGEKINYSTKGEVKEGRLVEIHEEYVYIYTTKGKTVRRRRQLIEELNGA